MNNAPRPITSLTNDRVNLIRSPVIARCKASACAGLGFPVQRIVPVLPLFVMAAKAATHDNHRLDRGEK